MSARRRQLLGNGLIYAGYAAIILLFVLPMLWVLSLSLRPLDELFAYPPTLLPQQATLDAYRQVLRESPLLLYLWNSVKLVVGAVAGALLVAIPSAYALSRLRFRHALARRAAMLAILSVQLISPLVIALPLYRYLAAAGLIDSQAIVTLVYVAVEAPVATWMLKGFLDTVPAALDESARIDGCTRLQALLHVLLPVMLPGIAASAIVVAISAWGQFLIPFILLDRNELYPIGVGILNFQSTTDAVSTNLLAAAAILSALPAVLIFLLLQRFIIAALVSGAVKG